MRLVQRLLLGTSFVIAVLVLRPSGLFGQTVAEKV